MGGPPGALVGLTLGFAYSVVLYGVLGKQPFDDGLDREYEKELQSGKLEVKSDVWIKRTQILTY